LEFEEVMDFIWSGKAVDKKKGYYIIECIKKEEGYTK